MLEFKPVTIDDKKWVDLLMLQSNFMGSEYTFANLFNWSRVYNIEIARCDEWLLMKSGHAEHANFAFPAGSGDLTQAVAAMEAFCKAEGCPLVIYSINEAAKALLEQAFPERFAFTEVRDNFDYIYSREKLATLAGSKYHGKRNHIARFKDNNPDWQYHKITEENLPEVIEMNIEWCRRNKCVSDHSLKKEYCAVKNAFANYAALNLVGGMITAGGTVVAFTFGSPSCDSTFVVHVEKAFSEIQGAYPIINQQFVANELEAYEFVNREDDLGDLGLRRAKESYRPVALYKRFVAKEKAVGAPDAE